MAIAGWIVDKSVAVRGGEPAIRTELERLAGPLCVCLTGELEQLYSARSADEYDLMKARMHERFVLVDAPEDVLTRCLVLQRDLAHHHGMWHRTPIPDLIIAETALHHGLGVLHVDRDYERIAEVRPLVARRLIPGR